MDLYRNDSTVLRTLEGKNDYRQNLKPDLLVNVTEMELEEEKSTRLIPVFSV